MRFTGGSVTEEKRRNGKSFNPKHWRICLSFTYDEEQEDGSTKKKRKRVTRIVEGTKTHAYEERDKLIAELDGKGEILDEVVQQQKEQEKVDNMTLTKLIELWDAARRTASKASERTLTEDSNRLRHVERHLGDVPVKDITIQMVEQTYAAIRKETGLSGTSMNQIHTLLKNVFEKGIDYDYIYRNPCTRVTAPRRNKPNRRALTAEEGTTLLTAVDESEAEAFKSLEEKEARRAYREKLGIAKERHFMRGLHDISCIMAVRIGLATGQRRGEVFALTWGDVDLDEGTIHVGHNVTYQDVVKTPKTDSGVRTIAIDPTTVEHLSMWKDRQAEELAKICVKQTDETPVCCSSTGGRIRIDNFSHWWGDLAQGTRLRRAQVPRAPAHTGHIAPRQRRRRQDRPDQARPRQRKHHARLVRPRHPAERPRSGNDARQPAQQQARGRRTERPAGKRCSDPRRIIPVAPSREPSQSHGRRLEGGIRKQASSSN